MIYSKNIRKQTRAWILTFGVFMSVVLIACATNQDQAILSDINNTTDQLPQADSERGGMYLGGSMIGAKLWADNCIRCHNIRPPKSLSDNEWDVVMMHMRVRAGLTGEEQREILKFLQAAN
jgi:hypothetical protein